MAEYENDLQDRYRDEFEDLLQLWAEYMRRPDPAHGFNGRASGGMMPCGPDNDQLYGAHDRERFMSISAAVDSLRIQERSALFKAYGLAVVWRFQQLDHMEMLQQARANLRLIFKRKNLLSGEYCAKMRADGTLHAHTFRKNSEESRDAIKPRGFSFCIAGFGRTQK
jgi:hypothetical protein